MKIYPFEFTDDVNLIVIIASVDGYKVRLALDTGASNTIIDLTTLLIVGYQVIQADGIVEIETGKGIINASTYTLRNLNVLGINAPNFSVCSYDFLANSVLSDIDGVLGVDFFKGRKLCIDFDQQEITVSEPR